LKRKPSRRKPRRRKPRRRKEEVEEGCISISTVVV
jgi:hypothetical protein